MSPIKANKPTNPRVPSPEKNIGLPEKSLPAVVKPSVSRPRHPWAPALAFFLKPNIASPISDPKWPTLEAVSQQFNIPLGTVLWRSANYGWTAQQREAEERFWTERNDAVMRMMATRYVQLRGAAFALAGKALMELQGKMNQPQEAQTLSAIIRAGQAAFDLASDAAGLSVAKAPPIARAGKARKRAASWRVSPSASRSEAPSLRRYPSPWTSRRSASRLAGIGV